MCCVCHLPELSKLEPCCMKNTVGESGGWLEGVGQNLKKGEVVGNIGGVFDNREC